jgi:hypothetical protein
MPLVRRRPLAGIATLGVVALIAGCGGGSDSLTADEFRTQADAICADFNSRSDALAAPTSPAGIGSFLTQGLAIQNEQLSKLEALNAPSELSGTYDAALALLKKQVGVVTTASTRVTGGEDPAVVITDLTSQVESLRDQARAKAKELGLKVCGTEDDNATTSQGSGTAPAPTTAPTTTAPAGGGTTAGYVTDVQSAATALAAFGTLLQGTTGVEDLKSKASGAQANLDTFDAAIARLNGYTLGIPRLDDQRAGLARTGPKVSDVLRRFLDAAVAGDVDAVQKLLPEVTSAIGEFQKAATG